MWTTTCDQHLFESRVMRYADMDILVTKEVFMLANSRRREPGSEEGKGKKARVSPLIVALRKQKIKAHK